jgi:hypothetical protein
MGHRIRTRMLLTALFVVSAVAAGGAASAFWGGSGSGGGAGTTGTTVAVTLTARTAAATLYPGGQAAVLLTVSNPNASAVHIGSLALDTGKGTGGFAFDAGHSGCAAASLSFTTQTNDVTGWTVPARVDAVNGTLALTLTNALSMDADAADACQGAVSTVYLAAGS